MKDFLFTVKENKAISSSVFELTLVCEQELPKSKAGQFIHLEVPNSESTLLRRPFCLFKTSKNSIVLLVAVVGKGSERLALVKPGEKLKGIMPIGNGFTLKDTDKKVVIVGGGIGAAPLYEIYKNYPDREFYTYLGYQSKQAIYLDSDFASFSREITVCTDDGSCGKCGYPTDYLDSDMQRIKPDVILTCGAVGMLKAVKRVAAKHSVPAFMSGEARMGCGVGACLVCTCKLTDKNGEVSNKRACVDGPVFPLEEIEL